ncbi:hypothetical protein JG688_00001155 [Phytophthora aleatoria]|uniref:Uncharacterized protein n=1 Tax=Phytophthora aleatoria TaxID=2496075 RepID=A0A8J5MDG9_9STRA|nr:hypothetical protein JG688_00001155 [Phytophthora aleatoria]
MLSKSDESFEIGTLENIFVVEREKLNGFKISTVTGQGQLKPFGWDKGTEAGRVQRVGVRGLYNLSTQCTAGSLLKLPPYKSNGYYHKKSALLSAHTRSSFALLEGLRR